MKICYSFSSLKDLSDLSKGEKILEILFSYGLVIDKIDNQEPIRRDFNTSVFSEMWKGVGIDGECSSCYFLFKGKKEIKFSGMVTWNLNLPSNTKVINSVNLWLNAPKSYNIDRLLKLGDDLFTWSEAVYGYITEESKDPYYYPDIIIPGNIYEGIPGLMWVNYFGAPYIMEPDFHISGDHTFINHGARIILSETPYGEQLNDPSFLERIKNKIGMEWFWSHPRKYNKRVPFFDKSEITKP